MTSDYEKMSFIAFANLFAENIPSSLTYKINYLKNIQLYLRFQEKPKQFQLKKTWLNYTVRHLCIQR